MFEIDSILLEQVNETSHFYPLSQSCFDVVYLSAGEIHQTNEKIMLFLESSNLPCYQNARMGQSISDEVL